MNVPCRRHNFHIGWNWERQLSQVGLLLVVGCYGGWELSFAGGVGVVLGLVGCPQWGLVLVTLYVTVFRVRVGFLSKKKSNRFHVDIFWFLFTNLQYILKTILKKISELPQVLNLDRILCNSCGGHIRMKMLVSKWSLVSSGTKISALTSFQFWGAWFQGRSHFLLGINIHFQLQSKAVVCYKLKTSISDQQ